MDDKDYYGVLLLSIFDIYVSIFAVLFNVHFSFSSVSLCLGLRAILIFNVGFIVCFKKS